ncbi:MAG: hypothetical protein HXS44_06350 [Theionarchaea archaeon]|nr:hypothetical protein [Theionarchaea archaeon]
MRKVILCIFILAYLSGVLTLVVGYALRPSPDSYEPPTIDMFIDEVKNLPWVAHGFQYQSEEEIHYYKQLTFLYSADKRIGFNLLRADWLQESITEEEAHALSLLVTLSVEDSQTAVNVSNSLWFQGEISSDELILMEKMLTLLQESKYVGQNIASSTWFLFMGTHEIDEVMNTVRDMPQDLAVAVSFAPWFMSDSSLSEFKAVNELITLYYLDKNLALAIPPLYERGDYESLLSFNKVCSTDRELVDEFLQYNTLSRENFLALCNLSRIAVVDEELSHSLISEMTEERIRILDSLAAIYDFDAEMGMFASEYFGNNEKTLQYLKNVLKMGAVEPDLMKEAAFFVSVNPEFVYEDRIEPYRCHLLTVILSEIPEDKVQEYKTLIFVTCSVYGSRFYSWQDEEYNTRNGWSYDECLLDLEKDAVMNLLNFFIEKNEEGGFVTDLRTESHEYLYGLVDIPFTHFVNNDGTVVEAAHQEQGTGFVLAIMYNIGMLEQRYEKTQELLRYRNQVQYTYSNPLVELILDEGEERDRVFLYFCEKNWDYGLCVNHTLQTRMDSIVMGISTTAMYWEAPDSAHMYPVYTLSSSILKKVEADTGAYGNPFVYKQFVAPYDEAGFRDSLDRDIESVEIYDPEIMGKIELFVKPVEKTTYGKLEITVMVVGIIVLVGAGTLRIVK